MGLFMHSDPRVPPFGLPVFLLRKGGDLHILPDLPHILPSEVSGDPSVQNGLDEDSEKYILSQSEDFDFIPQLNGNPDIGLDALPAFADARK